MPAKRHFYRSNSCNVVRQETIKLIAAAFNFVINRRTLLKNSYLHFLFYALGANHSTDDFDPIPGFDGTSLRCYTALIQLAAADEQLVAD